MSKILYCSDVIIVYLYFNIRIDVSIATQVHITPVSQAGRTMQICIWKTV